MEWLCGETCQCLGGSFDKRGTLVCQPEQRHTRSHERGLHLSAASDNSDQGQKDRWVNLNAFTATLVAQLHSSAVDRPDYSLFCIWTIRTALEDQDQASDVSIAAAAIWLIYASRAIWDFSQQSKSFDGKVAAPGASYTGLDWTGFSRARWDLWLQKLMVSKAATPTGSKVALIEQALDAMSSASDT